MSSSPDHEQIANFCGADLPFVSIAYPYASSSDASISPAAGSPTLSPSSRFTFAIPAKPNFTRTEIDTSFSHFALSSQTSEESDTLSPKTKL